MSFELRLIVTIALVVSISVAVGVFFGHDFVMPLFDWLQDIGLWAVPLFIAINMLVVVFVLPGMVVTMAAGFLFGVLEGSLYVVIATSTGASIAFFVARHLLSERWVRYLRSHPKLGAIERQFARRGWRVVLLTRLIPFFPFKISNYFFGATSIRFSAFFFGTLFGIVPLTLTNVYLGSIAADLATLGVAGGPRSQAEWLIYGGGFVVAIGAAIYFARLARRALEKDAADGESGSSVTDSTPNMERQRQ
ncbi:MAG: TVP38/TMEM64 family protein [Minwuiales bacterium]|nr:TVP38/TMEM64 family protein [Minwuiales bacterium]